MKTKVAMAGLKDLEKSLGQLSKATARNTLKAVLRRAGQPMADAAKAKAPVDQGNLRDSITVSAKISNPIGDAAFAKAMRAGLGQAMAVASKRSALRAARASGNTSFAVMYVGPANQPSAHLVEFGTGPHVIRPRKDASFGRLSFTGGDGGRVTPSIVNHPGAAPHPFMRPAFDETKQASLDIIASDIGAAVMKAANKASVRAARRAAKLQGG